MTVSGGRCHMPSIGFIISCTKYAAMYVEGAISMVPAPECKMLFAKNRQARSHQVARLVEIQSLLPNIQD